MELYLVDLGFGGVQGCGVGGFWVESESDS